MLKKIIDKIQYYWVRRSSSAFVRYLRSCGIKIGEHSSFRFPYTHRIDVTRPHLIEIGEKVVMNSGFKLLTHDFVSRIFRTKFHDFVNSSGKVKIGNNVCFGVDVIVCKGVEIGDNSFIGAGSVVTRSIPANSVAVGVPCRVICSIEEFYAKRKKIALTEAVENVREFIVRFGRDPKPHELREEFIYYVHSSNVEYYESIGVPIRFQLKECYDAWLARDEAPFKDFEEFLAYCKKE